MINPQWFELPMSRTNFHGPKDVWAIEIRLYYVSIYLHAEQYQNIPRSLKVKNNFKKLITDGQTYLGEAIYKVIKHLTIALVRCICMPNIIKIF